jgi:site-specific DNA-methyltransferase (adenine-specific)
VWDEQVLASQLLELQEAEFDIELLGFEIPVEPLQDVVEDELPEQVEPKSKLGDVWQLGRHRLMCGDSTDTATVQKLINGNKADLVFTDPPYGMFLDADYSDMSSKFKGSSGGNKYDAVIGDNADFTPDLITSIFNNFDYVNEIFVWGADYYSELLPDKNKGSWIVWDKRGDESADKMFGSTFEMCWSKARHKRHIARIKWAGIFGMTKEHDKKRQHPTQKPVALVTWFFEKWAKDLKNVVDVYGGSGSTLLACEQTDRTCFMMELDPKYVDVIIARWEKLTGQTAELIEG